MPWPTTPAGTGIGYSLAAGKKLHDFCSKCSSQVRDAQAKSRPLLLQDIVLSECNVRGNSDRLVTMRGANLRTIPKTEMTGEERWEKLRSL